MNKFQEECIAPKDYSDQIKKDKKMTRTCKVEYRAEISNLFEAMKFVKSLSISATTGVVPSVSFGVWRVYRDMNTPSIVKAVRNAPLGVSLAYVWHTNESRDDKVFRCVISEGNSTFYSNRTIYSSELEQIK